MGLSLVLWAFPHQTLEPGYAPSLVLLFHHPHHTSKYPLTSSNVSLTRILVDRSIDQFSEWKKDKLDKRQCAWRHGGWGEWFLDDRFLGSLDNPFIRALCFKQALPVILR